MSKFIHCRNSFLKFVYGCMKSGKSNELIKDLKQFKNPLIIKPLIDTRTNQIVSRTGACIDCIRLHENDSISELFESKIMIRCLSMNVNFCNQSRF